MSARTVRPNGEPRLPRRHAGWLGLVCAAGLTYACGPTTVEGAWDYSPDDAASSDPDQAADDADDADEADAIDGDGQNDSDSDSDSDSDGDGDGDGDDSNGSVVVTLTPSGLVVVVSGDLALVTASASGGSPPYTFVVTAGATTLANTSSLDTGALAPGDYELRFAATASSGEQGEARATVHVLPRVFDWSHRLRPAAPPSSGDWMTPVRDQLLCGSCWAYAATGVMEARYNIQLGNPDLDVDLSEQELIDCWTGAVGCGGGAPEQALAGYALPTGTSSESCRPTLGRNDTCYATCGDGSTPGRWRISGFRWGPNMQERGRAHVQSWIRDELVHHGPIPRAFVGILDWSAATKTCPGLRGDHFVVVVGYDHDAGTWLLRNSWGPSWNGNGYFETLYGECAVDVAASAIDEVIPPN